MKDLPSPHLQVHCTWRPLEPGALSYSFPPRLAAVQEIAGLLPLTGWHTAQVCPQIPQHRRLGNDGSLLGDSVFPGSHLRPSCAPQLCAQLSGTWRCLVLPAGDVVKLSGSGIQIQSPYSVWREELFFPHGNLKAYKLFFWYPVHTYEDLAEGKNTFSVSLFLSPSLFLPKPGQKSPVFMTSHGRSFACNLQ